MLNINVVKLLPNKLFTEKSEIVLRIYLVAKYTIHRSIVKIKNRQQKTQLLKNKFILLTSQIFKSQLIIPPNKTKILKIQFIIFFIKKQEEQTLHKFYSIKLFSKQKQSPIKLFSTTIVNDENNTSKNIIVVHNINLQLIKLQTENFDIQLFEIKTKNLNYKKLKLQQVNTRNNKRITNRIISKIYLHFKI
eukprot:TRINITY_DN9128_c0_g1_i6.p1 TRINITY_DN9128_c0_g1~~TRINITY_DN9128_c0_g1_i6.p1  ORF type:complete len:191 (-),score=-11.21 TRINITY_DN9128_c0_g1_i6:570-1142(-)